ncbi:hypothetical protein F2Q69_00035024 [Brassica cretica]|uniref:Uncharacterized protein n=1 Tax=Brassica cretica TaxID=69181 RepID=A0A8S9SJ42_BRACR|nr:hypothetical protein F2Q69_00035024 [Brassica cretica]
MLETKLSYGRGDGDEACCDGKGTLGDGGLHALREEMRVVRQDLGDKMTRVEQRPPLQAVRNVDRILNPNLDNRGEGVCINDDQRTGDDTGQQHGPNPNQRARIQHDDYGEEDEEDEDFLPRPRAPCWQNRNQGIVRQTALRIVLQGKSPILALFFMPIP